MDASSRLHHLPLPNNSQRPQILNPVHMNPYTLMVAGARSGKSAFLRLLLDTSAVAPSASPEQLASVARFVQGAACPTARIRTASLDISLDSSKDPPSPPVTITFNLVDTPTLDTRDKKSADAAVDDIVQFLESKFAETLENDHKGRPGDSHVHLCLYFLDPDAIVPPSAPTPPMPLVPRARTNSISHTADLEPVILDPLALSNPYLNRPALPLAEVDAIRLLSTRCNVLPVIARTDTLTTERLAAIKVAVRRDLADSGIGFGIFDLDGQPSDLNGSSIASSSSSPTTPVALQMLRLPYALISPDCYSHSDGVLRPTPSRHELVQQYSPPPSPSRPPSRLVAGKFVRSYRWGTLDVLDQHHCDFLQLRQAIFLHMATLQKYTREYLFSKYVDERAPNAHPRATAAYPPPPVPTSNQPAPPPPRAGSHPVPTIDGMYPSAGAAAAIHQIPASDPPALARACSPPSDPASVLAQAASSSSKSSRQRAKKITIACNFCRSRKLKCDGQRPACHQCQKRSHACDYQAPAKRRGGARPRRQPGAGAGAGGTGSESDADGGSGDEGCSPEPSLSPEVKPEHLMDRGRPSLPPPPFAEAAQQALVQLPPLPKSEPILPTMLERRHVPVDLLPHQHQHTLQGPPRRFLPPPLAHTHPSDHASAPPLLPPIREPSPPVQPEAVSAPPPASASAQNGNKHAPSSPQAPRKRAGTGGAAGPKSSNGSGGASNRAASHYGPKVVACNHCRARKTKCDGQHPTCSSCARRSLPCNYVNDPSGARRRTSASASAAASEAQSSPSGSGGGSGPSSASARDNGNEPLEEPLHPPHPHGHGHAHASIAALKREHGDGEDGDGMATKRMRVGIVDAAPSRTQVAVFGAS